MARKLNIKRAGALEIANKSAPRGWHYERIEGKGNPAHVIVRDGYKAERCEGEAHSNAYIDHCMECLNHVWGVVAIEATP